MLYTCGGTGDQGRVEATYNESGQVAVCKSPGRAGGDGLLRAEAFDVPLLLDHGHRPGG